MINIISKVYSPISFCPGGPIKQMYRDGDRQPNKLLSPAAYGCHNIFVVPFMVTTENVQGQLNRLLYTYTAGAKSAHRSVKEIPRWGVMEIYIERIR
jgi:hypothetical protein